MDRPAASVPSGQISQGWSAEHMDATPVRRSGLLFQTIIFLAIFSLLHIGWMSARGTALERLVIDIATVQPATALINHFMPDAKAKALASRITSPGGGINILAGCEGTEVLFLLLAALWSFPTNWRHRFWGSLIGTLLVYGLNQGRILALFVALRTDRSSFDLLHGMVAPLLLIALSCLFFMIWVSIGRRPLADA